MTERLTIFFEPLDVLHFRDHRPSDAGQHASSDSHFPLPSVFRGCVRTALFRHLGADFTSPHESFGVQQPWARALLGGRRDPGQLALRGPLLARLHQAQPERGLSRAAPPQVEPFFPPPHDLVHDEEPDEGSEEKSDVFHVLHPWTPHAPNSALHPTCLHWTGRDLQPVQTPLPWTAARPEKSAPPSVLPIGAARRYLTAAPHEPLRLAEHPPVPLTDLLRGEERVGITRDPETLTAAEHMLYFRRSYRLASGAGFAVDIALPHAQRDEARAAFQALHGRTAPLGGRGHRARMHVLSAPLIPPELDADRPLTGDAKLWLLTPAILPQTWPDGVALVITERTIPVGGYDLAARAPRALRRALPAGAVLHLRGLDRQSPASLLDAPEGERSAAHPAALAVP